MSIRKTLATARRVLSQLRHDPRTIALVIFAPILLITILKYVFQGAPQVFDSIAPMMLGIFPLLMMFLITSVATLRERTTGTLDRLMTEPMSKLDLVFGYALAFSFFALVQGVAVSFVTLGLLGVTVLKLFLHDLSELDQLYRIGALIAVAIIAILASFLYQRFLGLPDHLRESPPTPPPI